MTVVKIGSAQNAIISIFLLERNATDAKCNQGKTISKWYMSIIITTITTMTIKATEMTLMINLHQAILLLSPNLQSKNHLKAKQL